MNNQQKKQLDRYSMMIVSKYFKSIKDFIKMVRICKKFKEIPEMFHYNPVRLWQKTNLFPNIETYHVYSEHEKRIEGYNKYVYWYRVNYETYLKKKENEEFKNVAYTSKDWGKYWDEYKSLKGATILCEKALGYSSPEETDITGITKLERSCFGDNRVVKHIKLDKRITTIPNECFSYCSALAELDLSYIKILGNKCFYFCDSLTALTLPEMLFKVGKNCFCGLNEIEKIEIKGTKVIEASMNYSLFKSFKRNGIDVKGNISYNNHDRNKYGNEIPQEVSIIDCYCYSYAEMEDLIIPKSVTKLRNNSIGYCSIKSIDLSHVIKNKCYFERCSGLTSITISKNIMKPENDYCQFYNKLTELKNIELIDTHHIPIVSNHLRKIMDEKGYHYDKCIYIREDQVETNSIIPEEVNIVDRDIFCNYPDLETITIPSSVIQICLNNFNNIKSLESIEIQSTNIQCGDSCFYYLPKIKELDLRGVTSFGSNCICYCPSLTKLIIQNIPIENGLFGCDSLKEIEIIGIENNEYRHLINYKCAKILENKGTHCKRKFFIEYQSINNEETYCIPDDIVEIASNSFQCCQLKEVTIPSSVTLIKPFSFYYCNHLTHLIIEGNPQIKEKAIYCCSQLIQNQPELKQYS